jgi:hypothetical protein
MPTGYTADVGDGKVTDFRTFALRCARNFGATIMQRDDPMDALPKPREVGDYYPKRVAEAKAEIIRLETMTLAEAEREAAKEYEAAIASDAEYKAKREETRARYEAMLAEVEAWEPPKDEHAGLKKFMTEQLRSSIDFDCADYSTERVQYSPSVWLAKARQKAASDLAYAEKHLAEEIERCEGANQWITALYESLSRPPAEDRT